MSPRRFLLLAPVLLAAIEACGQPPPRPGAKPDEAQHQLGEALGALGSCFGPNDREPALEAVRPKLLRASLVPSSVFDDESAWMHRDGETRGLGFRGFRTEGPLPDRRRPRVPPPPTRPADYQGWLTLRRLAPGEFEWSSTEQIGLGPLPLDVLSDAAARCAPRRRGERGGGRSTRPEAPAASNRGSARPRARSRGPPARARRDGFDGGLRRGAVRPRIAHARLPALRLVPAPLCPADPAPVRDHRRERRGLRRAGSAGGSLHASRADPGRPSGASRGAPAAVPGTPAASTRPDESGGRLPLRRAGPRGGRPPRRPVAAKGGSRPCSAASPAGSSRSW